jgi:hypothetical protein
MLLQRQKTKGSLIPHTVFSSPVPVAHPEYVENKSNRNITNEFMLLYNLINFIGTNHERLLKGFFWYSCVYKISLIAPGQPLDKHPLLSAYADPSPEAGKPDFRYC